MERVVAGSLVRSGTSAETGAMRQWPSDDDDGWDRLLLSCGTPHVLQSAEWGRLKERWGWTVTRFEWRPGERVMAAAQVLTRPLAGSPLRVGYVPKGPILDDVHDLGSWRAVLDDLARWASSKGLSWLKIDPDVDASDLGVRETWIECGWLPSSTQVQFPNTMISDLTSGRDAVLAAMKSKTRYNIGLARRRGVEVRRGGVQDLDRFLAMYEETARRDGFGIRAREYYLDAWKAFLDAGVATVILAELEGRPLAGVIPVRFGRTAWYLYGASASEGRRHMPAYLAQWESLLWAMEQGCTRYDWWGGPSVLDESDPLWGVYRFKRGFGARMASGLGAWDYPAQPKVYRLFQSAEAVRRRFIAARRGRGASAR
jgi:lipid II:glycine glycyltransferase (peptidoglycan interpeptide bridge formation enzyme)